MTELMMRAMRAKGFEDQGAGLFWSKGCVKVSIWLAGASLDVLTWRVHVYDPLGGRSDVDKNDFKNPVAAATYALSVYPAYANMKDKRIENLCA
jgi:hypothetical protein